MSTDTTLRPRAYKGVMVSSTFKDLKEHREALIKIIDGADFKAVVMENDSAKSDVDVIDSSLRMVRDAAVYIAIIAKKLGQTPKCPSRNPGIFSITELEFNEAVRLGRPILLFFMGEDHPVLESQIELNKTSRTKLDKFRQRAKKIGPDSEVHRVYTEFNSLEEFKEKAAKAVSDLRLVLQNNEAEAEPKEKVVKTRLARKTTLIPKAPIFYAQPAYIGSNRFVGREPQLQELSDWAAPADPTNLLLFEAIGGNGKSMLTWHWAKDESGQYATKVRSDWAGRFWYSFYERGAIMADFCQHALAYMTGRPLESFLKKKTTDLMPELIAELKAKPWLIILDGLERVLVAYHRIDAAEVPDEEANAPTDKIANRNPCDAIREEDNDLLRTLAAVAPSKILVSSRLVPRVLLNPAGQSIPGVRRIELPGLRPADAEQLLRSCGIEEGDNVAIQNYLTTNCDNHPLVIGILGGLIHNYLPARGNFDRWVVDSEAGAKLDLGSLDLIQRRNHILEAALKDLTPASRQLLSTLALLSESVDYETLSALNPHLPPEPEEVEKPTPPEEYRHWDELSEEERGEMRRAYEANMAEWKSYEAAVQSRLESSEFREAAKKLEKTVLDLEQRGLLQYDNRTRRYDLHPVVRGVASSRIEQEDKESYVKRVVDHFSSLPHRDYEEADFLEELLPDLTVVRALLKLDYFDSAASAFGSVSNALLFNLEAYVELLSVLRPFFPQGWGKLSSVVRRSMAISLGIYAGVALHYLGEFSDALSCHSAVALAEIEERDWASLQRIIHNISENLLAQNLLAKSERICLLNLDLATARGDQNLLFVGRLLLFTIYSKLGRNSDAKRCWNLLDPMGRNWPRSVYRPGDAEFSYAQFELWNGTLQEHHLATAEGLSRDGKNGLAIRELARLRGAWHLENSEWSLATESFREALRLARIRGIQDAESEAGLGLARFKSGQLTEAQLEAERLAQLRKPAHRLLASLWLALGNKEQAKQHALAAYRLAWADGEPYVHRYELTKASDLLQQLGVPLPLLPKHEPANDHGFPWEDSVASVIENIELRNLNNRAAELRRQGQADQAEPIDRKAAAKTVKALGDKNPLAIHRRNNLALTLIMLGKLEEAHGILAAIWRLGAPLNANITPRVAFLRHTVAVLKQKPDTRLLGQIKTLLTGPELPVAEGIAVPWDIGYFIEFLKPKLGDHNAAFFTTLLDALDDRAKLPKLDEFSEWRDATPQPLD